MARSLFLADTSAYTRLPQPAVAVELGKLIGQGKVALVPPVVFELAHSARNLADYRRVMTMLDTYDLVPVTNGDHLRAIGIQELLAARGQHRALSVVDALVCAVAEARGLTVLHYDADFELAAEVAPFQHQWIVPRGSAD